ncbi:hypothetical protein [Catellatospora chokoriensis]|uniref:Uncharacterized protein n=1 Tax=Catellatospora chokoriensis TaxID=310353 RepID=A0A8J3NRZ5_9ACTN|nr:hypothetical protein [Catellatospora chokoriensis]GIF90505.1 hypothetical protein Cch02nite_39490 [Catellatospora chokoriensis]
MGKALDRSALAAYAKARIRAAHDIQQWHHPDRFGLCACGRPRPCTVAAACLTTIARYQATLALTDTTMPMPTITPRKTTSGAADDRPPSA